MPIHQEPSHDLDTEEVDGLWGPDPDVDEVWGPPSETVWEQPEPDDFDGPDGPSVRVPELAPTFRRRR